MFFGVDLVEYSSFLWFSYTTIVILTVLYSYLVANFDYFKDQGILGPTPWPIFGNLVSLLFKNGLELETERFSQYGKVYGIFDGRQPNMIIGEPYMIEKILTDSNTFQTRPPFPGWKPVPPTQNGIFQLDKERWKITRDELASIFTPERLENLKIQVHCCAASAATSFADFAFLENKLINIKLAMDKYFKELVCNCGLGVSTEDMQTFHLDFAQSAAQLLTPNPGSSIESLLTYLNPSMGRFYMAMDPDRYKNLNELIKSCKGIIMDRQDRQLKEPFTLLDMYMAVVSKGSLKHEDEFIAQLITMLLMGYHTALIVATMTFFCLAENPVCQDKLRTELREALKDNEKNDHNVVTRVKYLDQCIMEAMRLYPPFVKIERICSTTVIDKAKGLRIREGCNVTVPVYAIHRDPEFYPNPTVYDPERFSDENHIHRDPMTFLPFGNGVRGCIAHQYAMDIVRETVGQFLLKCRFFPEIDMICDPDPEYEREAPEFEYGMTTILQLKNLWVGLERLTKKTKKAKRKKATAATAFSDTDI